MKSILTSLCDFSGAWEGTDALYLSKCSMSKSVPITLREFIFLSPKINEMFAGTSSPTSVTHCAGWFETLAGAPTTNVLLAHIYQQFFGNFHDYMSDTYPETTNWQDDVSANDENN